MPFDPKWEEIHSEQYWGNTPDGYLISFLSKHYSKPPKSFLDLGCGTGANTFLLYGMGHDVVAVDGSKSAVERLVKNIQNPELFGRILPLCSDFISLEVPPESFDCIIDVASLQQCSLPEIAGVLRSARKWLRPGGRFFSKMACEPFDKSLLRVPSRMFDLQTISNLFEGYNCECHQETGYVKGDKIITHWIIEAQVA